MRFIALLGLMIALGACASSAPYKPAQSDTAIGYRAYPIEETRWRVTYRGGTPDASSDMALRRAAEVTLENGYEWFDVVYRDSERDTAARSGSRISIGGATGSGGGVSLGGGIGFGLGSASSGNAWTSLEILLGRGPKPDKPSVYDARAVLAAGNRY